MAQQQATIRLFPESQGTHSPVQCPLHTFNPDTTTVLYYVLDLKEAGYSPEAKTWTHTDPENHAYRRFSKAMCILGHVSKTLHKYDVRNFEYNGRTIPRAVPVITAVPNAQGKTVAYVMSVYVNSIERPKPVRPAPPRPEEKKQGEPVESLPPLEQEGGGGRAVPMAVAEEQDDAGAGDEDGKEEMAAVAAMDMSGDDKEANMAAMLDTQEHLFDAIEDANSLPFKKFDKENQLKDFLAARFEKIQLRRGRRNLTDMPYQWIHRLPVQTSVENFTDFFVCRTRSTSRPRRGSIETLYRV